MCHAKCMWWKTALPNSCDHSVQYTGLKNSFKYTETSTLLHNFNTNLIAYSLGASTNKYNIFSLTSTSRSRSVLVCAGDVLNNNNLKPSSSCKSKTWLWAHWAPKCSTPEAHLFSLFPAGPSGQMPLPRPFQIFAGFSHWTRGLCWTLKLHF